MAVLAGGRSRRMGIDKAFIEIDGVAMARRVADAAAAAGAHEVFLVGSDDRLADLGVEVVPDGWPGEGPLAGIITALTRARCDVTVVLACDHLHPDAEAIALIASVLEAHLEGPDAADVAVPVVAHRCQWLHAAWRSACVARIAPRFAGGARSVEAGTAGLRRVPFAGIDPASVGDADSPADLPARRWAPPSAPSRAAESPDPPGRDADVYDRD